MQSSNVTLGPYFSYAKNEKRLNKKQKTFINNLPQVLKVLSLVSHSFFTTNSFHNKKGTMYDKIVS